MINLCEMKYSQNPYVISAEYAQNLIHKRELFRAECSRKHTLQMTMITANGLKQNVHTDIVQQVITGDDLFIE